MFELECIALYSSIVAGKCVLGYRDLYSSSVAGGNGFDTSVTFNSRFGRLGLFSGIVGFECIALYSSNVAGKSVCGYLDLYSSSVAGFVGGSGSGFVSSTIFNGMFGCLGFFGGIFDFESIALYSSKEVGKFVLGYLDMYSSNVAGFIGGSGIGFVSSPTFNDRFGRLGFFGGIFDFEMIALYSSKVVGKCVLGYFKRYSSNLASFIKDGVEGFVSSPTFNGSIEHFGFFGGIIDFEIIALYSSKEVGKYVLGYFERYSSNLIGSP